MISIVMPVFNSVPYLRYAIEDILNQSYRAFELICVDDGSIDNTTDVLNYFMSVDERVKVIKQEHKGAGEARNVGMDNAVGEYIIFLDADDRYRTDMLELLIGKAEKSGADITLCDAIIFDNSSNVRMDNSWVLRVNKMPSLCFEPEECRDYLFEMTSGMPWNKLYKADFVKRSGIRYQNSAFWNDTYFSYMLLPIAKRIAVVPETLVAYRVGNSGSITRSSKLETAPNEGLLLLERIHSGLINYGVYDTFAKSYSRFVMEKFIHLVNHINDDNYFLIYPYISVKYLDRFGVGQLEKEEFSCPEYYEAYRCLKDKGRDAFVCRLFSVVAKAHEWYYEEKYRKDQVDSVNQRNVFYYDLPNILKGSRIVLYGAGKRGRQIREKIIRSSELVIVAWADAKHEELSSDNTMLISIDDISSLKYDYILIAVDSPDVMQEIRSALVEHGVENTKIIW